jgi:hypothetical protein
LKLSKLNIVLSGGLAVVAIAMLIRRVWLMELDTFEFDDAFMFIRYAENILAGNGYAWNANEPMVYGNTSILYTYVIAVNQWLFGKYLSISWVLISAALIFGIGFLLHLQMGLWRNIKSAAFKNRLVIALFTLPFLVFPLIYGFHISTGMETTLSLFLHSVFIFATLKFWNEDNVPLKSILGVSLVGYLLFLTRPDNAVVVAVFPIMLWLSQKKWKPVYAYIAVMAVIIGVDSLVKYWAFGEILPLSFYAKKSGFTEGYTAKYFWNPIKYITQFTAYLLPYILAISLFVRKKSFYFLLAFVLPLAITFAYYFTFDQIMGFNARLYFPFMPYIIVPAILLMDQTLQDFKRGDTSLWNYNALISKTSLVIVFLLITVFSKYRFINQYESWAIKTGNKNAIPIENLEQRKFNREKSIIIISDWLKDFPDDFVFGATEHGFISGDNPTKKIVDFSGLHNRFIAKSGYNESVLIENQPDFIWMPHQDLTVLHYKIRSGAYFKEHYEYIPNYFAFGCAIRKDSKYYDLLKAKFN